LKTPIQKQVLNTLHGAAVFKRRVHVLSKHLADEITEGISVLDVGCGDGSMANAVMAHKPNLHFEGIDVFLRPEIAIPAKVYDGINIPFERHSFDWVTIVDVLHHTDNPELVLEECVRVARKGVVIKDHLCESTFAEKTLRFMDWFGNKGHDVRLPYNYLSEAQWNEIFSKLRVRPKTWNQSLGIYPLPFSLIFDRNLHFVSTISTVLDGG
jgi:SAM-dependent methyltransferase